MARRHAEVFLELLGGEGSAEAESATDVPEPAGPAPPRAPFTGTARADRRGAASPATAALAATLGLNPTSSTLVFDDASGDPFHVIQARHIDAFREAWREAGHARPTRPVSRSIFALVSDMIRVYFGDRDEHGDHVGLDRRAPGRSSAATTRRSLTRSSRNSPRTRPSQPRTRSRRPCRTSWESSTTRTSSKAS